MELSSPTPTTLISDHGYVLDVLSDVTEYLAVELAAAIDESQLSEVGIIIGAMGKACTVLEVEKRAVPATAIEMVRMYREMKAKKAN